VQKRILHISLLLIGFIVLNSISRTFYYRFDLTSDQRFTLSEATESLVKKADRALIIKVYLDGDFPLDFKRIQQATKQHIEELKALNPKIHVQYSNPEGHEEELIEAGLQPSRLTIEEKGRITEVVIFPWAVITYKNKTALVPLLVNSQNSGEEQVQQSIENLEYAFSNALSQVIRSKTKSIAVLRGNGELDNIYLYDFLSTLKEQYNLAQFTLDTADLDPVKTAKDITKYDLTIIAKPTKAFSEKEKLILDQYIMHGGKTLWLLDYVTAEMDSLQQTGEAFFLARDLNLTEMLFSYGVRVNHNLVEDLYCSKIAVATGNVGNKTQFKPFLWHYYPLVKPNTKHPATKHLEAVNLKFPSSIDTLPSAIKKTILLQSSPLSKRNGLPAMVSLASIAEKINPETYKHKPEILGVLLEGEFKSAFQHRNKAFNTDYIDKSRATKMVVISDGDIIANQILQGEPTQMDVDKWTGQHFGNKNFLLNTVNYLLDDEGLLDIRGKQLDIKLLNKEKIHKSGYFWPFINVFIPLFLLGIFGLSFYYFRKRKYKHKPN